tara:strand:+ start:4145 stop:4738 length:594 start_codon:yes stop_codon:yes gene_type:complete
MPKVNFRPFILLIFLMALVVAVSNYLVQFPFDFFGFEEFLTYGAFSYPVTFLITDLCNRKYGKLLARKIVYVGFISGISLTLFFSTNFDDIISIRIALGSGTAFLASQLIDIQIFDKLRKKIWFLAPFASSTMGSIVDTLLFFSISFYGTSLNWATLALGDFSVKILIALLMLIPFRILMNTFLDTAHKYSTGKVST